MKQPQALRAALAVLSLAAGVALFHSPARAQQFFGAASLFEPEIDIVESGTVNDVQATVSHDRRYVTLTMRSTMSTLIALRQFQFQGNGRGGGAAVQQGFVGGVVFDDTDEAGEVRFGAAAASRRDASAGAGASAGVGTASLSPSEIRRRANQAKQRPAVLLRRGMTRVD